MERARDAPTRDKAREWLRSHSLFLVDSDENMEKQSQTRTAEPEKKLELQRGGSTCEVESLLASMQHARRLHGLEDPEGIMPPAEGARMTLLKQKEEFQGMRRTTFHLAEGINMQRRHQSHLRSAHKQRAVEALTREEAAVHALQGARLDMEENITELHALRASAQHVAATYGKAHSMLMKAAHSWQALASTDIRQAAEQEAVLEAVTLQCVNILGLAPEKVFPGLVQAGEAGASSVNNHK